MSYLDTFGLDGQGRPRAGRRRRDRLRDRRGPRGSRRQGDRRRRHRGAGGGGRRSKLRAEGADVLALGADVTQEADCERIVAATVERFGRLDIIVNAVGGGAGKVLFDAQEYPRDAWDWIMELNVRSTLRGHAGRRPRR